MSLRNSQAREAHGIECLQEEVGGEATSTELASQALVGFLHPGFAHQSSQIVIAHAAPDHLGAEHPFSGARVDPGLVLFVLNLGHMTTHLLQLSHLTAQSMLRIRDIGGISAAK